MTAEQLLEIYEILSGLHARFWIAGGWAIDALVGEQTREHNDLDLAFDARDEERIIQKFLTLGYQLVDDARPTRFVLKNRTSGTEIDMHPVIFDEEGVGRQLVPGGIPFLYPRDAFTQGTINGQHVSCLSAQQLITFHLGYTPLEKDQHNMRVLNQHLGIDLPEPYAAQR